MSESSKQPVEDYFRHLGDDRVDQAVACLADDLVWEIVNHARPAKQSKDVKRRSLETTIDRFPKGDFRMWPISIVAEGDRVAVEAEGRGTAKNDLVYHNRYHFAIVVKDSKISSVREYCDTDYATTFLKTLA